MGFRRRKNKLRPISRVKKTGKKAGECIPEPDCDVDCCDGPGCDLIIVGMLLPALMGYFQAPAQSGWFGQRMALRLIRSYQINVSAKRPGVCNLTPNCSRFGSAAVREKGLVRGLIAVRARLRECREAGQIS